MPSHDVCIDHWLTWTVWYAMVCLPQWEVNGVALLELKEEFDPSFLWNLKFLVVEFLNFHSMSSLNSFNSFSIFSLLSK